MSPNPKHKTRRTTLIKTLKNYKAKKYALEFQITKSDLGSHNLGLYLMKNYVEPCSHLNWFKIKLVNSTNPIYP